VSHHDGSKGHTRSGLHEPIMGSHLPQAHLGQVKPKVLLKSKAGPELAAACKAHNTRKGSSPNRDLFCKVVALLVVNVPRKFQVRPNSRFSRIAISVQQLTAATKIENFPFRLRHLLPIYNYIIKIKLQLIYYTCNTEMPKQVATEIKKFAITTPEKHIGYQKRQNTTFTTMTFTTQNGSRFSSVLHISQPHPITYKYWLVRGK
jgi:hypothetical protein